MKVFIALCLSSVFLFNVSQVLAQEQATQLEEVVVTAPKEGEAGVQSLPDVEGAKVYSGKKTSLLRLEEKPVIVNNSLRQAFDETPGLLISEESTPLVSIGNRGLNPDRAQFMLVLKDGIPIQADLFGYPEAYYIPPFQVVDRIEFIRGGASLMYGPQPGGALNFVTKDPYEGKSIYLIEENSFGSHDFYSNYSALTGTSGPLGYYGYFHHRQSQGFREFNSQYEVYYGGAKLVIEQDPTAHWILAFDLYEEEHGEPGGLTRFDFDKNPEKTTRLIDHFELNRYAGSVTFKKEVGEDTYFEAKGYGAYYERLSWRQRGGGFGTLPTGASAGTIDIQDQTFYTGGGEVRARHDYSAWGFDDHSISGGVLYQHTTSPRSDERGTVGDALDGPLRMDNDRETDYLSFFVENLFGFGKLSITPGVRFENIWQDIVENVNVGKTAVGTPLGNESEHDFVVLSGVGVNYEAAETIDLYTNFSQGYRPKVFSQSLPLGSLEAVNEDLKEGRSWQVDAGIRGNPTSFLSWDASFFYMEFDDQVGTTSSGGLTIFQNVGDARHHGVEVATEFGVVGLADEIFNTDHKNKIGELSVFYAATFLDAEFVGGPLTGKTPAYAPDFIQKGGAEYNYKDKVKVRFAGNFYDDHFANDSNTATFSVPSYKVWDLTGEVYIYKDAVKVFGGVNNIFDEHYFARVTSAGIDPADGRNYFAGVTVNWG